MTIINDLRREELANVQAREDFNYDDQQTHRVFYWDVGIKMHERCDIHPGTACI
jgi:hypothetical protein